MQGMRPAAGGPVNPARNPNERWVCFERVSVAMFRKTRDQQVSVMHQTTRVNHRQTGKIESKCRHLISVRSTLRRARSDLNNVRVHVKCWTTDVNMRLGVYTKFAGLASELGGGGKSGDVTRIESVARKLLGHCTRVEIPRKPAGPLEDERVSTRTARARHFRHNRKHNSPEFSCQ